MTAIQKAMVLLDMARDQLEIESDCRPPGPDNDDIQELTVDIGTMLLTLQSFSKWPRWDDATQ